MFDLYVDTLTFAYMNITFNGLMYNLGREIGTMILCDTEKVVSNTYLDKRKIKPL